MNTILEKLNEPDAESRIGALSQLHHDAPERFTPSPLSEEVNNHVHTIYSFSPYSPTAVAAAARISGLRAVGSVDHDSISAADELHRAARIIGIGATSGFELRVSWENTPFKERRLNSPDATGVSYVVVHGVPAQTRETADALLRSVRAARHRRNREQVARLNRVITRAGIEQLSYDTEIEPLSEASRGGTVTERHILFALANKLVDSFGRGPELLKALQQRLRLPVSPKQVEYLTDPENPHYLYDVLGVMKAELVPQFYLEPDIEECIPLEHVVDCAHELGAILAYPYLGDITESATGDKKAAKFEDDYIDTLFPFLRESGFHAVTYMPPRNSKRQLLRVQELCRHHEMMEISGVDINSSRQVFTCPEVLQPEFRHLIDATWALIAHEELASRDLRYGMFHPDSPAREYPLPQRINAYAAVGRSFDLHRPDSLRFDVATLHDYAEQSEDSTV